MRKIIKNSIRCKHCGDVIESNFRHDFKTCKCGKVSVDGGTWYLSRSFPTNPEDDFEELSEYGEDSTSKASGAEWEEKDVNI